MNFINNRINKQYIMQTTLKSKLFFSGIGIHNGKVVSMTIEPASEDTGIVFERIDLDTNNKIKATIENVETSPLCTKIKNEYGVSVSTIEHLMAAFNGLNIDNVIIRINSSELPAMDGSAEEYTKKIIEAGIKVQNCSRKYLKILKKITIEENQRNISITPANELTIDVEINYPGTIIGNDKFHYQHSQEAFIKNVSKARTFAFYEDIQKMHAAGLGIGGNLNNAVLVDKFKIVNPLGLRLEKEFTKHKTLDCLGDFYLLGMPIIGRIECLAPGHKLNQKFIKEILKEETNYEIQYKESINETDSFYNILTDNYTAKII